MNQRRIFLATALATVLAAMLSACATPHAERGTQTQVGIENALAEAAAGPAAVAVVPPAAVSDALLPADSMSLPTPVAAGPDRFDVNVSDTPARAFFAGLVEGTGINMVLHPGVSGKVSLRMKNVTVPEVLSAVQDVYGYEVRPAANGYVVMPAALQTRIFQINYLDLQRNGVSSTRVSSGQVSQQATTGGGNNESPSQDDRQDTGQHVTGTRIDTVYQSDFWAELNSTLSMIIGTGDGRRVVINSQTGVIMVRAMPEELRTIDSYLASVQSTAQRQVILEAKIIEVQLNDAFQAGINWASVVKTASGRNFLVGQSAPTQPFQTGLEDLGGVPITVGPGVQYDGFETSTIGGAITMALDSGDFNGFVELLEVQGETRVLSSPRVATLNNQKAVIKAGTDEFFVTDVSSNTVTGTSSTTSRDVELTPFFSGIALDVTPQISGDGTVTLHIHPTVSEVTDQEKNLTISGETDRLPLAFSEIRESDTVVRARSGQIIVIGGLMRSTSRDETYGTPLLGRIPGVGALFRSKRQVEKMSELVILLKPVVVESEQDWADAADGPLQRMREFAQR